LRTALKIQKDNRDKCGASEEQMISTYGSKVLHGVGGGADVLGTA